MLVAYDGVIGGAFPFLLIYGKADWPNVEMIARVLAARVRQNVFEEAVLQAK